MQARPRRWVLFLAVALKPIAAVAGPFEDARDAYFSGDVEDGSGSRVDMIASLVGIGWVPTDKDLLITLVQYLWSYRKDAMERRVSQTVPRLIYIRKLPGFSGWAKADIKMVVDHSAEEEFSTALEAQLGHRVSSGWGVYAEAFIGNSVLGTNAYDYGAGIGIRFMY